MKVMGSCTEKIGNIQKKALLLKKISSEKIAALKITKVTLNVVLEKTPASPLGSKDIKPVNLKGNQPWTLIGGTDAEAETPVL